MGKTATNEQKKLRATYLNGLAVVLFTFGIGAPLVSWLSSVTSFTAPPEMAQTAAMMGGVAVTIGPPSPTALFVGGFALFMSVMLHSIAISLLATLED